MIDDYMVYDVNKYLKQKPEKGLRMHHFVILHDKEPTVL